MSGYEKFGAAYLENQGQTKIEDYDPDDKEILLFTTRTGVKVQLSKETSKVYNGLGRLFKAFSKMSKGVSKRIDDIKEANTNEKP